MRQYKSLLSVVLFSIFCFTGCPVDDPEVFTDGGTPDGGSSGLCTWQIPSQAAATGKYTAHIYKTGSHGNTVSISNRGWRAAAGSEDGKIRLFTRTQQNPLFTYNTKNDTGTNDQVNAVAISPSGNAFAAGSTGGRIYYFECDQSTPLLNYNVKPDAISADPIVDDVAISKDGFRIAAVSREVFYLFERSQVSKKMDLVLKLKLGSTWLTSVALSSNGKYAFVGTMPESGSKFRVFYLNDKQIIWSKTFTDLGWVGGLRTPVAISGDGQTLAAGGADHEIHFWNSTSSTPLWSYKIASESPVASIKLSENGKQLAASGNWKVHYFNDTSVSTPTFTDDADYRNPSYFGQPVVYPGNTGAEGSYSNSNTLRGLSMSSDGTYLLTAAGYYGHAFSYYKGYNRPFRIYDLDDKYESMMSVDISPDGSWVMFSGMSSGEIRRLEVAPVELLRVPIPLTISVSNTTQPNVPIASGDVDVEFTILKPGRAAKLSQSWRLYSGPVGATSGLPFIPSSLYCPGTTSWNADSDTGFLKDLGDGNQISTGVHSIELPTCMASYVTATIDSFVLRSTLTDHSSGSKPSLSDYTKLLLQFVIN